MKSQGRPVYRSGKSSRRSGATPQKSISVRVLTITAVVLALLAVASYAWHTYQLRKIAPDLLVQAEALEAQGKHRESVQRLYQYLQINPDDTAARLRLAETYEASAETAAAKQRAIELYTEVLRETPANDQEKKSDLSHRIGSLTLELALGQLASGMADTDAGRRQVLGLLKAAGQTAAELVQSDPEDAAGWRILTLSLATQQQMKAPDQLPAGVDSIGAAFRRALELDPGDADLAVGFARILRKNPELLDDEQKGLSEAERARLADDTLDKMVAARPDDPLAYLTRYGYQRTYPAPGETSETSPREDASDLAKALELGPDQLAVQLTCGSAAQLQAAQSMRSGSPVDARRQYEAARDHYQRAIELAPADARPYLLLAGLHREHGEGDLAISVLQRGLSHAGAEDFRLNLLLAECELAQPRGDEATESKCQETASQCLGIYNRTISRFRNLMSEQTARTMERAGQRLQAQLLLRKNQPEEAVSLLEKMLIDAASLPIPERIQLGRQLEQSCRALERWDDAARAAEEVARLVPDALDARIAAALDWMAAGKAASAVGQLEDVLSRNDSIEIRILLATAQLAEQRALSADQQDWGPFSANLAKLKASNEALAIPNARRLVLLEAAYLRAAPATDGSDAKDRALKCLRDAECIYPESLTFLDQLAATYREMQAESDAARAVAKSDLVSALNAGDIEAVRQRDDALHALDEKDSAFWSYYHARRLIAEAKGADDPLLEAAAELQSQVAAKYPDQAAAHVLGALICQKRQDVAGVIEACRAAFDHGERGAFVCQQLVSLLLQTGQLDQAESYLADLKDFMPLSDTLRGLEIAVEDRRGDRDAALALANRSVQNRPTDPLAWLRLGQLLVTYEKKEDAEEAFKKALVLAPNDRRAMSALFELYSRGGRPEEANAVLKDLAGDEKLTASQRAIVLALGAELLGDRPAAEKDLREALEKAPDDVRLHLQMAGFLLRGGGPEAISGAEKLLRDFLGRVPESPEAKRALASLLTLKGGQTNRQEAIGLMEELASSSSQPVGVDESLLGQLYEREADWQAADRAFETMVAGSQTNPARLASYVGRLLQRGSIEEAGARLEQLERIAPNDFRTIGLKVRWLRDAGRAEEIPALIKNCQTRLLEQAGDDKSRKAEVCGIIGDLYTQAGQHQAAEAEYRGLTQVYPQGYRPLALSLARQGKIDEAIQQCLEASKSDETVAPAVTLCSVLLAGSPTKEQREQAEPLLAKTAASGKASPEFLSALAAVRLAEQRTDDAIQLYQKVLKVQPENHLALNNLAALLADDPASEDEALAAIDRAIDAGGMRPAYMDTKATLLLKKGDVEQAITLLKKAVASPGRAPDPRHLLHLASAYQSTGKVEEARQTFKAAVGGNVKGEILTKGDLALLSEMEKKLQQ